MTLERSTRQGSGRGRYIDLVYPGVDDRAPMVSPDSIPELVVVMSALRRGARTAQFRLLDISCPRNHRLGQVLRTTRGPVLVGMARPYLKAPKREGAEFREIHLSHNLSQREPVALALDEVERNGVIVLQCRCTEARMRTQWIHEQLLAKARRLVWRWEEHDWSVTSVSELCGHCGKPLAATDLHRACDA